MVRLSFKKSCMLRRLLMSSQPIQLKTLSACVLVAGTQRYFFASLAKVGKSSSLECHQSQSLVAGLGPLMHRFWLRLKMFQDALLGCLHLLLHHVFVLGLVPGLQVQGEICGATTILDLCPLLAASIEAEHAVHVAPVYIPTCSFIN